MDRAEKAGFGVALVGHGALLTVLSLGVASWEPAPPSEPIEVSFVEEVGPVAAAPQVSTEPPAPRTSPDTGPTQPEAPAPAPAAAVPNPRPAPPQPQPRQTRETRPTPAPPQPQRTRSNLPDPGSFDTSAEGRSQRPPAATMSASAAADIASAIARQVQPCADRQVHPGPGAERIVTPVRLRLNRDGSLAARPTVGRQTGIDDENGRYADRVADLAVRSFIQCSPLRGLPQELYDVPNGWRNFTLRYRLPG